MQKDCYRTYYRPLIDRKIGWREPVSIIKLGIVKRSTMPRKSSAKSAPGECGKEAGESMPDALGFQGGGVRAAILTLIKNYENIMKNILEAVTEAIVIKLMNNPKFTDTLAKNVLQAGVLDNIKQELYDSCALESGQYAKKIQVIDKQMAVLEKDDRSLRNAIDDQEQYSRQSHNCLLLHGIQETNKDTDEAVLATCNNKLGLQLTQDCIDRSHRPGGNRPDVNIDRSHRLGGNRPDLNIDRSHHLGGNRPDPNIDRSHRLGQGWPTSQRLRATFFTVLPQRATSYIWAHMNITPSLPLSHTHTDLCSARFIVNVTHQHDNDRN